MKKRYADGGDVMEEMTVNAQRPQNVGFDLGRMPASYGAAAYGPPAGGGMGTPAPASPLPMGSTAAQRPRPPIGRTAGYLGPTMRGEDGSRVSFGVGRQGSLGVGAALPFKKGGSVKAKKAAPKASSASKRGDGIASKGKTKGRFV